MSKAENNRTDAKRLLDRLVMRPGAGWHHLSGAVWEHSTGIRIHTTGELIALNGEEIRSIWQINGGYDLFVLMNKICGGNRKRALMAMALTIAA